MVAALRPVGRKTGSTTDASDGTTGGQSPRPVKRPPRHGTGGLGRTSLGRSEPEEIRQCVRVVRHQRFENGPRRARNPEQCRKCRRPAASHREDTRDRILVKPGDEGGHGRHGVHPVRRCRPRKIRRAIRLPRLRSARELPAGSPPYASFRAGRVGAASGPAGPEPGGAGRRRCSRPGRISR